MTAIEILNDQFSVIAIEILNDQIKIVIEIEIYCNLMTALQSWPDDYNIVFLTLTAQYFSINTFRHTMFIIVALVLHAL